MAITDANAYEIVANAYEIGPNANAIDANAYEMDANAYEIEESSWTIFPQYAQIMNAYLTHFMASVKYQKEDKDGLYLLINGFTTLTHIFKILLNTTGGLSQAIESTEKAIYYYTEFIEQMEENIMHDLNVSSNNASLFVYKKTIYHLQPETRESCPSKKNVDYLLLLYRSIFDHLLEADIVPAEIPEKMLKAAMALSRHTGDETLFTQELNNVLLFIQHFPLGKNYYDAIYLYLKKYKHRTLTLADLCQKKIQPNYSAKLNEPAANYIKWLLL
jgi:hypothetical protein